MTVASQNALATNPTMTIVRNTLEAPTPSRAGDRDPKTSIGDLDQFPDDPDGTRPRFGLAKNELEEEAKG